MSIEKQPIPLFSLGVAGAGRFSIAARQRLDAYIQYNYTLFPEHRPMRVVVAVETPFERRTVERVAALRCRFPQMSLTVMIFSETPREAVEALADEVFMGENPALKHDFLAELCDEVIDCYNPARQSRSRELHRIAGSRVLRMAGRKVTTAFRCMKMLADFCGFVPPGRLAENCPDEEYGSV